MADGRIIAQQNSPAPAAEGSWRPARGDRMGVQFTATWKQALLLEGRCFHAPFAAMGATDLVALAGGLDLDQPDFCISVPSGTSLVPLHIVIAGQFDADAAADDAFAIIMADIDAAYAGDGTVVAVTAQNMITGGGVTSVATVFENASVNITSPTVTKICLDVAQTQQQETGGDGAIRIDYEPEIPFILDGPAAIYGYIGGDTDPPSWAGFATWAEVPTTRYAVS